MKKPKVIIAIIVVLFVVIVLAQNSEAEQVDFLFWSFAASKFVVYLCFYAAGILTTLLGLVWRKI